MGESKRIYIYRSNLISGHLEGVDVGDTKNRIRYALVLLRLATQWSLVYWYIGMSPLIALYFALHYHPLIILAPVIPPLVLAIRKEMQGTRTEIRDVVFKEESVGEYLELINKKK